MNSRLTFFLWRYEYLLCLHVVFTVFFLRTDCYIAVLQIKNLQSKVEVLETALADQEGSFEATVEKLLSDLDDARSGAGAQGRAALMIEAAEKARIDAEEQIAELKARIAGDKASLRSALVAVRCLTEVHALLGARRRAAWRACTSEVHALLGARRRAAWRACTYRMFLLVSRVLLSLVLCLDFAALHPLIAQKLRLCVRISAVGSWN